MSLSLFMNLFEIQPNTADAGGFFGGQAGESGGAADVRAI
jgi:hypothetical protein